MKSIEIKGLTFVQTHDEDPVRFDVRDADFKRVAYVEWDGVQLVCSTPDAESKILYQTDVKERYLEQCLGYVAATINTHLNSENPQNARTKKMKVNIWNICALLQNHNSKAILAMLNLNGSITLKAIVCCNIEGNLVIAYHEVGNPIYHANRSYFICASLLLECEGNLTNATSSSKVHDRLRGKLNLAICSLIGWLTCSE